jgi:hypothetical protein
LFLETEVLVPVQANFCVAFNALRPPFRTARLWVEVTVSLKAQPRAVKIKYFTSQRFQSTPNSAFCAAFGDGCGYPVGITTAYPKSAS